MVTSIKILILEHDPYDIDLLQYQLSKSGLNYASIVVQTKQAFLDSLSQFCPDIILSDYSLPTFDGLSAFRIKQEMSPNIPFIIVSGTIGEENAVELIRSGVTDYVLKEKLYQVPLKVKRALDEAAERKLKRQAEMQLQEREEQLQKIMDLSLDVICTVDSEGRFVTVGAASTYVWGYTPDELIGTNVIDLVLAQDKVRTVKAITELRHGVDMINFENRIPHKNGKSVTMLWSGRWDESDQLGYTVGRDATEIKKAERKLQEQNKLVSNILEGISDGFLAVDHDWTVTYWNKEAERMLRTPKEAILGTNLWLWFEGNVSDNFYEECHRALAEQISITFEEYYQPSKTWYEITVSPSENRLVAYFRDVTARKIKQQLDLIEKEMLELYTVKRASLASATSYLLEQLQLLYPEMYCAVLRHNEGRLKNWGAAPFPPELLQALEHEDFSSTSCGIAAAFNEKVVVPDVAADPNWPGIGSLFESHGLRGCTAYPMCDAKKKVLGVFAVFLREPRVMQPFEEEVAEFVVNILKPLIESELAAVALKNSEKKYRNLFDMSPMPMWVFDTGTFRFIDVNASAIQHYGYSKEEFAEMTIFDIRPKEDLVEFEKDIAAILERKDIGTHRHVKKNGDVIFVDVRGNLIELAGKQAKLILAADISERIRYVQAVEKQNIRLREIAWVQSHVVRAPLARIMGLVNVLESYPANQVGTSNILQHIAASAYELDDVIRDIVQKAEQVKDQPVLD